MDSVIDKELNDYLDIVRKNLKTYALLIVKEQYQDLYKEHQKLMMKMMDLKDEIKKLKGE